MEKYRSLPFATYDLAVYLPGGAVLLVLLGFGADWIFDYAWQSHVHFQSSEPFGIIIQSLFWLSVCYLAGHLGAFISSYAVERFVHNVMGYPADIWLLCEDAFSRGVDKDQAVRESIKFRIRNYAPKNVSRGLALFVNIPFLVMFLLFYWKIPAGFYVSKLPDGLKIDFDRKYKGIKSAVRVGPATRWDKVVEHYVSNNCPMAYDRMYNYLVIYGALRLMTFIILMALWIIGIESLLNFFRGDSQFSFIRFVVFSIFAISGFLSMAAFAKFNRRYFEETIFALLFAPRFGSSVNP